MIGKGSCEVRNRGNISGRLVQPEITDKERQAEANMLLVKTNICFIFSTINLYSDSDDAVNILFNAICQSIGEALRSLGEEKLRSSNTST